MRGWRCGHRDVTMQAKPGVIEHLNTILTNELTAINQYFIQSRMCSHWGYERLAQKLRELSIGEMQDADKMINHILYLEGVPNLQRLGRVRVGENVLEHLQITLELEKEQLAALADRYSPLRRCRRLHHPRHSRKRHSRRGRARGLARNPARDHQANRPRAVSGSADLRG